MRTCKKANGFTANEISHRKYQYIRAQQLSNQSKGIPLMPSINRPTLPAWDDKLTLPPSFEEYLLKDELQEIEEDTQVLEEDIQENE